MISFYSEVKALC